MSYESDIGNVQSYAQIIRSFLCIARLLSRSTMLPTFILALSLAYDQFANMLDFLTSTIQELSIVDELPMKGIHLGIVISLSADVDTWTSFEVGIVVLNICFFFFLCFK